MANKEELLKNGIETAPKPVEIGHLGEVGPRNEQVARGSVAVGEVRTSSEHQVITHNDKAILGQHPEVKNRDGQRVKGATLSEIEQTIHRLDTGEETPQGAILQLANGTFKNGQSINYSEGTVADGAVRLAKKAVNAKNN